MELFLMVPGRHYLWGEKKSVFLVQLLSKYMVPWASQLRGEGFSFLICIIGIRISTLQIIETIEIN